MSYIDRLDYEFIATLGYLPIYHPLVEVQGCGWGCYDFGCNPSNLVLGGGAGEHPGLVLHKLESIVAKFLVKQLLDEDESKLDKKKLEWLEDLSWVEHKEIFEFCGWSVENYADLSAMVRSSVLSTPLAEGETVEDWIALSIGELIYFSLCDLNPHHDEMQAAMKEIPARPIMRNVMCYPPGYPVCAGRRIVDGKLNWGLYRWQ